MMQRFPSNKSRFAKASLSLAFQTLPMILFNCTLRVVETEGVLWTRLTMFLKVVELWLCFKTQKVCKSLIFKIYVQCNSFRHE